MDFMSRPTYCEHYHSAPFHDKDVFDAILFSIYLHQEPILDYNHSGLADTIIAETERSFVTISTNVLGVSKCFEIMKSGESFVIYCSSWAINALLKCTVGLVLGQTQQVSSSFAFASWATPTHNKPYVFWDGDIRKSDRRDRRSSTRVHRVNISITHVSLSVELFGKKVGWHANPEENGFVIQVT